jgi:hypothetical protein
MYFQISGLDGNLDHNPGIKEWQELTALLLLRTKGEKDDGSEIPIKSHMGD